MNAIEITALSPLVFGDGRPFSNEAGAQVAGGLELPPPSTLAGALRAHVGRAAQDAPDWDALLAQSVHGPLLHDKKRGVLVPAPSDMILAERGDAHVLVRSRPRALAEGDGMDLPEGLRPALIPEGLDLQPTKAVGPRWLGVEELAAWYAGGPLWGAAERNGTYTFGGELPWTTEAHRVEISTEPRTHVGLAKDTRAAERGLVYATKGVDYGDGRALLARAEVVLPEGALFLGGERRLAAARKGDERHWNAPESVRAGLAGARQIALVLATPAHFGSGWKPDVTALAARLGTALRLVGVACRRREAVSGWDLVKRRPKPARWLAPAGSVYWFETSDAAPLAENWLLPVSDDEASRRDGFGLALFFPTAW